jgi:hypothetical protein
MTEELQGLARRHRRGAVRMTFTSGPEPIFQAPLVEPSDMVAIVSPCHPWEPIKILENWDEAMHCLVCGQLFAIP